MASRDTIPRRPRKEPDQSPRAAAYFVTRMRSAIPVAALRLKQWPVAILIALAPLWLVGALDRGLWTPDEPREADIAWRMSQQTDRTLPQLAGKPFLEKPPLTYWLSAAGIAVFDQPR